MLALGWCATFFWFYYFYGTGETWGYAVIDAATASYFWRRSRRMAFALPLFYAHVFFVGLNLLATIIGLADWWLAFLSNRLFEGEMIYIVGCSIYRSRMLRNKKGRPFGAPQFK